MSPQHNEVCYFWSSFFLLNYLSIASGFFHVASTHKSVLFWTSLKLCGLWNLFLVKTENVIIQQAGLPGLLLAKHIWFCVSGIINIQDDFASLALFIVKCFPGAGNCSTGIRWGEISVPSGNVHWILCLFCIWGRDSVKAKGGIKLSSCSMCLDNMQQFGHGLN